MSVGVALITHNAERHLSKCLPPWLDSPLKPKVLVVDSSSSDRTAALAKDMGADLMLIPRKEFNHGLTRELARRKLGTDIVVMATPDAYPEDREVLGKLIAPIAEKRVSLSYARQLPHENADFFAAFHREFNYPETGHIRSLSEVEEYGVYAFFCSDSCAAYANSALDLVGGFPRVLIGEDTVVAAKLLRSGRKIAYVAEARVRHSHNYNLRQEFVRHFDTGLARKEHAALLAIAGRDVARGKEYARELLKKIISGKPQLLPYALFLLFVKFLGYKAGTLARRAPLFLKKALSGQDYYWKK